MSEHVLSILVKAIGTAQASRQLKGLDGTISRIGATAGKGLRTAAGNIARLGTIAAGVGAAGLVASVKAATDFEAQLNTINTVSHLADSALQQVGDDIRKVARDSGTSLEDLTTAYYDLVSAGIEPGTEALGLLKQANTLAIGGLATTAQTVDLLTTAVNTYGLDAAGAAKATDQFAEAIALGKVTADEISASFAKVGPFAQSMGIGIDEIAASYAALTAKGIPAGDAMTQMRSAMVALSKPTGALATAQDKLGVNFAKVARKKGLTVALEQIRKYSEKTGVPLAKLMGRIEGVNYLLATTGDNATAYKDALYEVQTANGTAADQMSERQQGLNYQLSRLKALAIDAGITLGNKLLPKITPLAEKAVKFLETHQDEISAFGDKIAAGFDKAVQFAEQIPWGAIGDGLKTAADWGGRLLDAFNSMPADMKSTIIALAGLNKLSGGAIGGIVSELGKGLIKGVLGINAGVVNVRGAVVNSGGGIGAGAGAGAGGAAAGAGGLLAPGLAPLAAGAAVPFAMFYGVPAIVKALTGVQGTKPESGKLAGALGSSPTAFTSGLERQLGAMLPGLRQIEDEQSATNIGVTALSDSQLLALGEQRDTKTAVETGAWKQEAATRGAAMIGAAATGMSSYRIVSAIQSNRPITNTNVVVTVTAANVQKSISTQSTYGAYGGSAVGAHNGRNILD